MLNYTHFGIIIGYLLCILAIGLLMARKGIKGKDDFLAAGRSLSVIVVAGTLLATWVGGGGILGAANFTYTRGPIGGFLYLVGAPIGIFLLFFIAGKVRQQMKYTVPELIEKYYGKAGRIFATFCIVMAYSAIISYQFRGGGYILNITIGVPLEAGTAIAAVVMILLAVGGGMKSIAYSDFASALLIVGAMILGVPFILAETGGLSGIWQNLPEIKQTVTGGLTGIQFISYMLPILFLLLGDQNMYQRFGAARNPKEAVKSNMGFFIGEWIVVILTVLYAAAAIALFPNLEKADTAVLTTAAVVLPTVVGGLVLAAAVAFLITTGDSFLMSVSSNLVLDIYVRFKNPGCEDQKVLFLTRMVIIVVGIVSFMINWLFPDVLTVQMYAYSMYGAAITPALLGAILWKKVSKTGGLLSIVSGSAAVIVWDLALARPYGINSIVIAGPVAIVALIIGSLFVPNRPATEQEKNRILSGA